MDNPVEVKVAALLAAQGIIYNVTAVGPRIREGWECDAWLCLFSRRFAGRESREEFEFFTGTGLREQVKRMPHPPCRKGTLAYEEWASDAFRARAPEPASVLYSIILDSGAVGQSFESWCDELGYDADSRKAEATYRACQQNADKLARVIDGATREQLAELLRDY